jgi:hypothetical protein
MGNAADTIDWLTRTTKERRAKGTPIDTIEGLT